jgi:Na+-translocating ferredoxin:NAD+ oxidoreductase RnfE subunit
MNTQKTAALIASYGGILLLFGVLHIILTKAFVPLEVLPCLIVGIAEQGISYYMVKRVGWSFWAGLGISGAMILLTGWLSIQSLYNFIDVLQNDPIGSLYDEGSSFFILFTVFIVSLLVGSIQVMLARSNARELSN